MATKPNNPRTVKAQGKEVELWNSSIEVGQPVTYWRFSNPLREPVETKTVSPAWLLGGHTAVVKVDGIAGGVNLSHVAVRKGGE